jgi:cytochrome c biogenesis protein CcmG, thiol:disulfide interchange protein DsbE
MIPASRPGIEMRCYWLLIAVCLALPAWAAKPKVGAPAPTIDATTLDGARFSLAEQHGKVVVINFWATWCEPCRAEMPALDAFYKAHRAEGLEVLAVNMDDDDQLGAVKTVMSGFSFPAARYSDTQAAGYGRIWRLPLTFVIDRKGVLRRDAGTGASKVDATVLETQVLPLLREAKARND